MANPYRGEVQISIDGVVRTARLTLGALAELEAELETDSLMEMAERFETGRFSAADVSAVIIAGLRGGGWDGKRADLLTAEIEDGPIEAARKAAQLLGRAFTVPT